MIRDQYDDDDIDEDDILRDGERLRVPIQMLDSTQRSIALNRSNRPGFRYADADDDDAQEARDEYIRFLQDAHRQPDVDTNEPYRPASLRDARAEAERAYDERSEWLRNAHKGQQP